MEERHRMVFPFPAALLFSASILEEKFLFYNVRTNIFYM